MEDKKLRHDLNNSINRLKIMAELLLTQNFSQVSKPELQHDIEAERKKLNELIEQILKISNSDQ